MRWTTYAFGPVFVAAMALAFTPSGRSAEEDSPRWQEKPLLETPGWLPISAVYTSKGKTLILGGAAGEVAAFDAANRVQRWKTSAGNEMAAVALSADEKSVLATFQDGVQYFDVESGKPGDSIEAKESHPVAVGVFPDRQIESGDQKLTDHKVVFGNARGYIIKEWIEGGAPGTIELSNVPAGKEPDDPYAVPLAVDPAGRSVVITGPVHRDTGKNVLWAYVAGNYDEGSPGNRLLEGHTAPVVCAAWSAGGKTVVTGDTEGTVITWDAASMTETRRRALGDRVAAVAVTKDGAEIAAVAIGQQAKYYVWKSGDASADLAPLATDAFDFGGPVRACLAFSPDGRQLVGSAVNFVWLSRSGRLVGKVHVWEAP